MVGGFVGFRHRKPKPTSAIRKSPLPTRANNRGFWPRQKPINTLRSARSAGQAGRRYKSPQRSRPAPNSRFYAAVPLDRSEDGRATHPQILRKNHISVLTYKTCPSTLQRLQDSIDAHMNDPFQVGNHRARNCAGWACERLADAGLTPPVRPNTPWLRPQRVGGGGVRQRPPELDYPPPGSLPRGPRTGP